MVTSSRREMQRLTISVNKQLARSFDELIKRKGYRNRSEAFRHVLRKTLQQELHAEPSAMSCVVCLSFAYDQQVPQILLRLAELKQRFLSITISSTLTVVNPTASLETLVLRGSSEQITAFAHAVSAEADITCGQLNLVPIHTA
jgi:CopG family transcriptional regulator, nickel-responsive regulator